MRERRAHDQGVQVGHRTLPLGFPRFRKQIRLVSWSRRQRDIARVRGPGGIEEGPSCESGEGVHGRARQGTTHSRVRLSVDVCSDACGRAEGRRGSTERQADLASHEWRILQRACDLLGAHAHAHAHARAHAGAMVIGACTRQRRPAGRKQLRYPNMYTGLNMNRLGSAVGGACWR